MKSTFQRGALRTLRLTSAAFGRNRDCADIPHVESPTGARCGSLGWSEVAAPAHRAQPQEHRRKYPPAPTGQRHGISAALQT